MSAEGGNSPKSSKRETTVTRLLPKPLAANASTRWIAWLLVDGQDLPLRVQQQGCLYAGSATEIDGVAIAMGQKLRTKRAAEKWRDCAILVGSIEGFPSTLCIPG